MAALDSAESLFVEALGIMLSGSGVGVAFSTAMTGAERSLDLSSSSAAGGGSGGGGGGSSSGGRGDGSGGLEAAGLSLSVPLEGGNVTEVPLCDTFESCILAAVVS